jgi:hypothetical protein
MSRDTTGYSSALGIMDKKKKIAFTVLLILGMSGAFWFFSRASVQVIGKLPPKDLGEIQHLIWNDVRSESFATFSMSDFFGDLRFWLKQVREYNSQRILWITVSPDGQDVEVFVGVSKARIRTEGYSIMAHKDSKWKVTGKAHWGIPEVAAEGAKNPPP